jgi:CheY-like chemotaxis protein
LRITTELPGPDGAEAVALARELRPDVVLMDVRMPVQDGIEATRQIKEDDETADVKVLILTTFDLGQYVYAAREVLREVARGCRTPRSPSGCT